MFRTGFGVIWVVLTPAEDEDAANSGRVASRVARGDIGGGGGVWVGFESFDEVGVGIDLEVG